MHGPLGIHTVNHQVAIRLRRLIGIRENKSTVLLNQVRFNQAFERQQLVLSVDLVDMNPGPSKRIFRAA